MNAPQPSLYRTPSKPGFMGSYNWVASTLGLIVLVLFSSLATQYIASRFQYQPALGSPLLRTPTYAVYQPFHWAIWGWLYCTSKDPRIRQPLFEGEMIVFGGAILSVAFFFVVAGRRARRLSKNAEDLHGSARWATEEDIRATGLLDADRGVYVGGWYDERARHLHYLRHNGPEHVLAFAPTRSGKGVGLVIPTLLAWEESAVVYDIKGENWAKTAGFRCQRGHLCFKFSPVEEGGSSRFNPLAEIRLNTNRDVADAQNVANMIVRTGEDSPQERYWQDAAVASAAMNDDPGLKCVHGLFLPLRGVVPSLHPCASTGQARVEVQTSVSKSISVSISEGRLRQFWGAWPPGGRSCKKIGGRGRRENRRFSTFDIHGVLEGLILCRALNHLQACRKRVDPNFRKWIFENGCDLRKMLRITQIVDTAKTSGIAKSNESLTFRHFSE